MSQSPEHFRRVGEIFDRAVELEAQAREEYLAEACAGDSALRAEVEALLLSAESTGPLDCPVESWAQELAADAEHSLGTEDAVRGRRVGPWEIDRPLGAGGMGRVFLAERAEGEYRQRCALKLLRWEMASAALVERFRTERQILADLEHPGIARLIDGGLTDDGLPYLAMELVEGEPIDVYAQRKHLDVEQRLRLFLRVVETVEYAHRNLVVHRDLKPSNILVTEDGRVKLLDFGIAKMVDPAQALTHTQLAPASLLYAAPEQLTGGAITTATDVWALGTLLFLLLAERTPFDGSEPGTVTQRILEVEPPALAQVAPPERARGLRGDLENIVAKALEKDPARRYSSAERLGEDIQRHLSGEPINARAATLPYRFGKYVRRHRRAVAATAVVFAGVVALVVFYTLRLADERDRARLEARKTEQVKGFLVSLFEQNDPSVAMGEEVTVREVLDRGADRVEEELQGQPEIAAEMQYVLGGLYFELGIHDRAEQLAGQSAARWAQLDSEHPERKRALGLLGMARQEGGDFEAAEEPLREAARLARLEPEDHDGLADALNDLGLFLSYKGEYDEAIALLEEAVQVRESKPTSTPTRYAGNLMNLGLTLKWSGDSEAAEPYYRRAQEIRREHLGEEHPSYADGLDNLGVLLGQRGDFEESEKCFREALAIRRRVLGDEHPDVAINLNNLASLFFVQKRYEEAEPIYREVIAINEKVYGPDSPRLATNYSNLGSVLNATGRSTEAYPILEEALRIRLASLGEEHLETAISYNVMAGVSVRLGDLERAEEQSARALSIGRGAVEATSPRLGQFLRNRADVLLRVDRADEARPLLEEAVAIQEKALDPEHWELAVSRGLLAVASFRSGPPVDDAESTLVESLDRLREMRGEDDLHVRRLRDALAARYRETGRDAAARVLLGGR